MAELVSLPLHTTQTTPTAPFLFQPQHPSLQGKGGRTWEDGSAQASRLSPPMTSGHSPAPGCQAPPHLGILEARRIPPAPPSLWAGLPSRWFIACLRSGEGETPPLRPREGDPALDLPDGSHRLGSCSPPPAIKPTGSISPSPGLRVDPKLPWGPCFILRLVRPA